VLVIAFGEKRALPGWYSPASTAWRGDRFPLRYCCECRIYSLFSMYLLIAGSDRSSDKTLGGDLPFYSDLAVKLDGN
jgi:hypothetical protein